LFGFVESISLVAPLAEALPPDIPLPLVVLLLPRVLLPVPLLPVPGSLPVAAA
jgi:hypothetical protein